MLIFWWRWAHNYVWLLKSIFIPGMLYGFSGLLSTFASIYGAQSGQYGTSSIITLTVTGLWTLICGFLTAIYFYKLNRVKRVHRREMEKMKSSDDRIGIGEVHYV
jgi:hypothetical protein